MRSSSSLTLNRAIEILEIKDLSALKNDTGLKRTRRKAKRRWHPDTIAALNPNKTTVKKYEENFSLVDEAIDLVQAYLDGEFKAASSTAPKTSSPYTSSQWEPPPPPKEKEPEEIILENAPYIQRTLQNLWGRVKELKYKMHEQVVTVAEGPLYSDLIQQDLEEDMPSLAVCSLYYGLFWLAIIGMIGLELTRYNPMAANIFAFFYLVIAIIQPLSCIIGFLPLSRFWLPPKVSSMMVKFVNAGLAFPYLLDRVRLLNFIPILFLFYLVPQGIAKVIKVIIVYPLYAIVGAIYKDKRMGKLQETVQYYAGYAEWYVERLINTDPREFTRSELFDLSALYYELREEDLR